MWLCRHRSKKLCGKGCRTKSTSLWLTIFFVKKKNKAKQKTKKTSKLKSDSQSFIYILKQ